MPRTRPPYPAVCRPVGQADQHQQRRDASPTCPGSSTNGAEAYRRHGRRDQSAAPRSSALAGKVVNGGLVEVPMGSTLRHLIFDVGGGMQGRPRVQGRAARRPLGRLRAGQTCWTRRSTTRAWPRPAPSSARAASWWSTTTTCMVDLARFFLDFTQKESCGKCVPCRLGTKRMLEILDRIMRRRGPRGRHRAARRAQPLHRRGHAVRPGRHRAQPRAHHASSTSATSTRPTSTRSAARPASCKALITYYIDGDCTGCMLCAKKCPTSCITRREEAGPRASTRTPASSATPAARSASSTPSRCGPGIRARPLPARAGA